MIQRVKQSTDRISRTKAFQIAPDYVKFTEGDFSAWHTVNEAFEKLRKGQRAITFLDGEYMEVTVTSINHNDIRAVDGPIVRVGNDKGTWRVDGCGYAWPL